MKSPLAFRNGYPRLVFSLITGLAVASLLYLSFFQRNFFSWSYLAYSQVGMILTATIIFIVFPSARNSYLASSLLAQRMAIYSSIFFSLLLLMNFTLQPFHAISPRMEMAIHGSEGLESGIHSIEFLYLRDELGYIPYDDLVITGEYQILEDSIRFNTKEAFRIQWDGQPGRILELAFEPTSSEYQLSVAFDEQTTEIGLFRMGDVSDVVYSRKLGLNPLLFIPYFLSFMISFSTLFFFTFLLTKGRRVVHTANERPSWFIYIIPPIISILIVWMILWPGVITPDSINQWRQAQTLQFTGWFPMTHTLLLAFLTRIWNSPAVVVGFQSLALLTVLAFGFRTLERLQVPRLVMATLSLIIAAWPPFALTSVTLWKDSLFGASMLWLFIEILAVIISERNWMNERANRTMLILSALLVALMRQNGVPVVILTFLGLILVFRSSRKILLGGLIGVLVVWLLVQFPLTEYLSKDREDSISQANLILLGHLAAHINAGTEISPPDRAYLEGIVPPEGWDDYDCCYAGDISYLQSFDRDTFLANISRNWEIFINLIRKNPMVNLRHQQCAGEIVWRLHNNRCQMKSLHGITRGIRGSESWIIDNDFGLVESSLFPSLVQPLMNTYRALGFFEENRWIIMFRPALFSFAALLCISLASFRLEDRRLLLLSLPVLGYIIPLFLINFSPAFRYQYPIILIGLFSLGLPFIPSPGNRRRSA